MGLTLSKAFFYLLKSSSTGIFDFYYILSFDISFAYCVLWLPVAKKIIEEKKKKAKCSIKILKKCVNVGGVYCCHISAK